MAIPVAVLGGVTPLVAAIAMSLSSILVVAKALRLGYSARTRGATTGFSGRDGPSVPLTVGARQ